MAASDPLDALPPDLPEMPIRRRIGLLRFPVSLVFLAALLALAFIRLSTAGDSLPLIVVLAASLVVIARLWRLARARQRAIFRRRAWWTVRLDEDGGGLSFSWEPVRLADLMPRIPPMAYAGLLPTAFAIGQLPQLLGSQLPVSANLFLIGFVFIAMPSIFLLRLALFAARTPETPATLRLDATGLRLEGPELYRPGLRRYVVPDNWLRWGGLDLAPDRIAGVAIDPGGVVFRWHRRWARSPRCLRLPTLNPTHRRAIAAWAAGHAIPVSGHASP
ncbi:MAG: hypothetical protein QNJ13_15965 [Paracoccaceae bacterium]|nr:hypothetical protein [Paracoccaceae bacterium]